ncbi:MAG TPA: TonB family protein [Nitrospiraceae bacterium]|nr:TonB family protein [Nitrospiraceae bacterium]
MSAGTFPQMSLTAYGGQFSSGRYMKMMIGLSLVLHLSLLLFIAGLRLPNKMERPLAAYQVSLVTMPTPPSVEPKPVSQPVHPEPSKVTEPPKTLEPPVTRPTQQVVKETPPPPPPHPVRLAPTPHVRALEPIAAKPIPAPPAPAPAPKIRQEAPPPAPVPPPVMRQVETKPVQVPMPLPPRPVLNRDPLRGIAPPDVPKLGQMNSIPAGTPKETRSQTQADVHKILNNLTLPEPTPPSSQPMTPPAARAVPPRPSMSEEVTRQLQKLEQAPPKVEPSKVEPPKATTMPESQVASKSPAARTPVTTLQASGVAAGNPYLALVQRRISEQWTAPPVDITSQSLQVVVKFRLDRSGKVTNIDIERKSGNDYYDLAARRAVLLANPLPSFPDNMSQPYFDAHFSFAVGEPVS